MPFSLSLSLSLSFFLSLFLSSFTCSFSGSDCPRTKAGDDADGMNVGPYTPVGGRRRRDHRYRVVGGTELVTNEKESILAARWR
jgi:hypothetical protein